MKKHFYFGEAKHDEEMIQPLPEQTFYERLRISNRLLFLHGLISQKRWRKIQEKILDYVRERDQARKEQA